MSELSQLIAETAARVLAQASPADGFNAALWAKIEAAGLDRVLLSEDQGGTGEDFEAAVAVARAAGAAAASVPICETLVANWALSGAGLGVEPRPRSLFIEPTIEVSADAIEGGTFVRWGNAEIPWHENTSIIAVLGGRRDAARVAELTAPIAGRSLTSIAGEPILSLDDYSRLSYASTGDMRQSSSSVMALYATLMAAALSGAMTTVNAMTFEYANTRKQFGRTLGAFQAIQHMAARMAEEAAAAEAAVQVAARALTKMGTVANSDRSTVDDTAGAQETVTVPIFAAAVAKARASEAAGRIAASAHQIHGAIGFTREHALQRYTRRLWAWRDRAGSEQHWHEVIGRAALAAGRDGLWPGITSGLPV